MQFRVSDFLNPPQTVWLRFDVIENGGDSYISAGVDAIRFSGYATDLRIVTNEIPNWTASHPFSIQLEAAHCGSDTLTWIDRLGQLEGTGLALSTDGLLSGIPTAVGPVVFRAHVTDQSSGYDERLFDFLLYDALEITTGAIPAATINEVYSYQLHYSGGTGTKSWTDHDNGLVGSGFMLSFNGKLSGSSSIDGEFPFSARVTDEVGAFEEKQFTLRVIGPYVCGDANSDETVNVGDAVFLIYYIFNDGPAPDPLEAGDANCDGQVNVGDAVYIINFVFNGGPEPCCP
jgi:hypothetical protein